MKTCACGNTYYADGPSCAGCIWRADGDEVTLDFNVWDDEGDLDAWTSSARQALAFLSEARLELPEAVLHVTAYPQHVNAEGFLTSEGWDAYRSITPDELLRLAQDPNDPEPEVYPQEETT